MTLKKQYLKSRPKCKVTFRLPRKAAGNAEMVNLVGDFNNWSVTATPMKRLKSGDFTLTIDLDIDAKYEFRYLIDGSDWENDWEADKYVPSPFPGSDNSVIVISP
jgi:1,4-alpha-glucan branching enzyme